MADEQSVVPSQERDQSSWLTAHDDPLAGIFTFSSCIALSDLNNDGEYKLIMADVNLETWGMKLKVFKGLSLLHESTLVDLPSGVLTFYIDSCEPRTPAIAVASSSYIYIYKNMKPYFKFTLPGLDINTMEHDIWSLVHNGNIDTSTVRELLEGIQNDIGVANLSAKSQYFLMLEDLKEMEAFLISHKHTPLKKQTVITTFNVLKKNDLNDQATCCLVLGTEHASVYILDPEAFTILFSIKLPAVPASLSISGLYDVQFTIAVGTRDGHVLLIKKGSNEPLKIVQLSSMLISVHFIDKYLAVATMNSSVKAYSLQGKSLWSVTLPASISVVEIMELKHQNDTYLLIACINKELFIYKGSQLIEVIETPEIVSAMKFGRFGREDNTLIMVLEGGRLLIKILKRTAKLTARNSSTDGYLLQHSKLNIPKKTKLFVDQTMRERENCAEMHQIFQHDLFKLRLMAARSYVNILENSATPISSDPQLPLRLSAQVLGLGPTFCVKIEITNTSNQLVVNDLMITFNYDARLYSVKKHCLTLGALVPNVSYVKETLVECLTDLGIADNLQILILKRHCPIPLISALIKMPVSEVAAVD